MKKVSQLLAEIESKLEQLEYEQHNLKYNIKEIHDVLFPERSTWYIPKGEQSLATLKIREYESEINRLREEIWQLKEQLVSNKILK